MRVAVGYHRELLDLLRFLHERSGKRSLRVVGTDAKVSAAHLSNVFNGKALPSPDLAVAVARALGATKDEQDRARHYADGAAADRAAAAAAPVPRRPAAAPCVREWDPIDLGVHRAIRPLGLPGPQGELPLYVQRRLDAELARLLLDRPDRSRMVLLVGASSTGKSRACYEAARSLFPEWSLVFPTDAQELVQLLSRPKTLRETVVWLNETQTYLYGPGSREAAAQLRRLLVGDARRVVVLGSMWTEFWHDLMSRSAPGPDANAQVRQLFTAARFHRLDMPADFRAIGEAGRDDLEGRAREDPRLATAIRTTGEQGQITQVLAGGVGLVDYYEHDVDAYGKAVITAAPDVRRLGHDAPVSADLLRHAVAGYLDAGQRSVDGDWFAGALGGATREVLGIRALQPTRSAVSMGPAEGYVVHDYLDYHYRSQRRWALVPGSLWDAVAAHAAGTGDRLRLALAAQYRGLYRHAVRIAGPAARAGDPHAGRLVAQRMLERDRTADDDAVVMYERQLSQTEDLARTSALYSWLADLGTRPNWDHTMQNLYELDPIMLELHRIEQAGGPEAALEYLVAESQTAPDSVKVFVVSYLDDLGRPDEALAWQRRLAETGDPGCISRYADRLIAAGRPDEAVAWLRRAVEIGTGSHVTGVTELMMYLQDLGERAAATAVRRFGIEPGGATAAPWDA